MNADDLTKPLTPMPRKQRRGIVLPIVAATLSGVFSGWLILFDAAPDRVKPLSPTSAPQPALAESVQQASAVAATAPAMPTAKTVTLTVIDSQTGAKREIVVPASDNQSDGDKPQSTATINPADMTGSRSAAKSKRH
jgi:hypothetical protein